MGMFNVNLKTNREKGFSSIKKEKEKKVCSSRGVCNHCRTVMIEK